jgi:transposase
VQVERELIKGAQASGYPNDMWPLQRVAEMIERMTEVAYHPAHVWFILRHELNWSWSWRPARRASKRKDDATHQWVQRRWPGSS